MADDPVKARALDPLHRVVTEPADLADVEYGDDVCVMQARGSACLV
jgi:hypothetical protein